MKLINAEPITRGYASLLRYWKCTEDDNAVFKQALDTYGAEAQTLVAFEEMAELEKELCKHARGRDNRDAIAEEIADVLIMLEQMMLLHDCKDAVADFRLRKIKRLAERLKEEKDEKDIT